MAQSAQRLPNTEAYLQTAIKLYKAGALDQAAELCRSILKINRRDFDTWNFLGSIHIHQENFLDARKALTEALKIHPQAAIALCNLGVVYEKLGHNLRAKNAYEKAIKAEPNYPVSYANLASILRKSGNTGAALKRIEKALSLNPHYFEALKCRGMIEMDLAAYEAAIHSFQAALSIRSNDVETLMKCAEAETECERYPAALAKIDAALRLAPDNTKNALVKARLVLEIDEAEQALLLFQHLLEQDPDNVEIGLGYAKCLIKMNQIEAAKQHLETWIEQHPDHPELHSDLGQLLANLGQKERALEHLERALSSHPNSSSVHFRLSRLKKYTDPDTQIESMQALLEQKGVDALSKSNLHFALSKASADLGHLDSSFKHLQAAHACRRAARRPYNLAETIEYFEISKAIFAEHSPQNPPTSDSLSDLPTPIMIVGMPRSGTTLTEQILSSHSEVYGAGELTQLHKMCHPRLHAHLRHAKKITHDDLTDIRTDYLNSLRKLEGEAAYVSDKMPANFRYVGFILSTIPDAKVINLVRDPRAVCWSIYKQNFNVVGHKYADEFDSLAHYYSLYLAYMEFWRERFPGRIYDLNYATLTHNQEAESRKLLAYCGLDWQEAVLRFNENKRSVKTVSNLQVRQKIYTGSSEAWRQYERHLAPLIEALQAHNVPLPD